MSYYNFNDHFWLPKTVCRQSASSESNQKNVRRNRSSKILTIACVAVWSLLLLEILVLSAKNQKKTSLNTNSLSDNCLVAGTRDRLRIYCFVSWQ